MSTETKTFVSEISTNLKLNEFCDSVNRFIRKKVDEGNHILEIFPDMLEKEGKQFVILNIVMTSLKDKYKYIHSLYSYKIPEVRMLIKEREKVNTLKFKKNDHRIILQFSLCERILSKILKKNFLIISVFESSFVSDKPIVKFIKGLS